MRLLFLSSATALLAALGLAFAHIHLLELHPMLLIAAPAAVLVNLSLFLLYGWDKRAARRSNRRTPERLLHLGAACGGWPGAWLAQRTFRHKTRKQPFRRTFFLTALPNVAYLGAAVAQILMF